MHYATTKSNATELHRQDTGKVKGYCGKFAPNPVDPETASMGLASRAMRTCRKCDEIAEDRRRAELSLTDGLFVTEVAASSAPVVTEESLFGAEELADLYVTPKRRQPRPSAPPEEGGLFGDAELAAAQDDAEPAERAAAESAARSSEYTPASLAEADPAEADARDRAADVADLADMVAEAEIRARVQAEIDHEDARKTVPKLGWSRLIHDVLRAAATGRLVLGADGEPRIVGANGGQGHKTRTDRLLMLVGSGMLNRARRGNPLTPTADGARALYLADLYPDGVYATDREAYTARLKVARKTGVSGEEAKNAARRLPPLPHGIEEERRVKAMFADMRRSVERVEEIRRQIDERAEQARREEADRKRARSASKAPAREGGRLRHVFCGPDPRIVAQWEAERAEAARRPAAEPARPSSAASTPAAPPAAPTPVRSLPAAPPRPSVDTRAPASGAVRPGPWHRSIGHPHTETSATSARPPREVDHGCHGRWPIGSTQAVAESVPHRSWPVRCMTDDRWPIYRHRPSVMADGGRSVMALRCAVHGGVTDALRCDGRVQRAANKPCSPAGIRVGVSIRVSAARRGVRGIRGASKPGNRLEQAGSLERRDRSPWPTRICPAAGRSRPGRRIGHGAGLSAIPAPCGARAASTGSGARGTWKPATAPGCCVSASSPGPSTTMPRPQLEVVR
ncbi:hypothetical protein OG422_30810 (plasmid) [Streptomyces sp. NBC_01525]|uniref:hypothetical protein n=1 Tax=Streptomyces sp. NBC_01525 TaxID=2903893 RepID=UPI002F91394E